MNEIEIVVVIFAASAIINLVALLWTFYHTFMNKYKKFLYVLIDDDGRFYNTAIDPQVLKDFTEKFKIDSPGLKIVKLVEE